jgi:hypothetical protein
MRQCPSLSDSKLPADFKVPGALHPAKRVTVMSGAFHVGMGDKLDRYKSELLKPGGFVSLPAKMNHFAWTKEETILQVHGVGPWAVNYVNPADDPRKK